jgi:hypothetical protein
VLNGGFETGDLSGWTTTHSDVLGISAYGRYALSGNYSVAGGWMGEKQYISQILPTVAGHSYTLTFSLGYYTNCGIPDLFQVFWHGSRLLGLTNFSLTDYPTNMQFTITDDGSGSDLRFGFSIDSGLVEIDDISVVDSALAIYSQTWGVTVNQGQDARFDVCATGLDPKTYQWRCNGVNIAGATNTSLIISNVQYSTGPYSVVVNNSSGSVTSYNAYMTVFYRPSITTQPSGVSVNQGGSVCLSVVATGSYPLSYQWQRDGGNIEGATSASLCFSDVSSVSSGNYTVVVANGVGSVTSSVAVVTVNALPVITTQPQSRQSGLGVNTTFTVGASGALTYQWKRNGLSLVNNQHISGATSAALTLTGVTASDVGFYTVTVGNSVGTVDSIAAGLSVGGTVRVNITTQPQSQASYSGSTVTFTVFATGTGTLNYQWARDGVSLSNGGNISGATSSSLTVANISTADIGLYTVYVCDQISPNVSVPASLSLNTLRSCITEPKKNANLP